MSHYSFVEVFEKTMELYPERRGTITKVVIPKIQRPYAQGRTDAICTRIREHLLDDMFAALSKDQELELNFIYGNVVTSGDPNDDNAEIVMELLDGQQRFTTLFLLHWYIMSRELSSDEIPMRIQRALHGFVYETRRTSSDFCQNLANFHPKLTNDITPSATVRNSIWYRHSFECDSSVTGMLNMLDAIHEKYSQYVQNGVRSLYQNLDNLRFHIKSIGEFSLKEDLYVKMNARGLLLSAFENFKADLTNYLQLNQKGIQDFICKIDTYWIDIFWSAKADANFDEAYLKTISRVFAALYIADGTGPIRDDNFVRHLYTDMNAKDAGRVYGGFDYYKKFCDEYIDVLTCVFDAFYNDNNQRIIIDELPPLWERPEIADQPIAISQFREYLGNQLTHSQFAKFAAIILYIRNLSLSCHAVTDFVRLSFHRWMRVTSNLVENTDITNLDDLAILVRRLAAIAHAVDFARPEGFYKAFSNLNIDNASVTLLEEQDKAAAIASDPLWEGVFENAEAHPFFKGCVHCLYWPEMSRELFASRFERAKDVFDTFGIASLYREHTHLLMRALLSDFVSWEELQNLFITESVRRNPFPLKNFLKKPKPKAVLSSLLDEKSSDAALAFLQKHIEEAPLPVETDSEGFVFGHDAFVRAVQQLRHNSKLYDYVAENENENRFRIYDYYGSSMVLGRYNGQRRIYLDTDRSTIATKLVENNGFTFRDERQKLQSEESGLCFGDELRLYKKVGVVDIELIFSMQHKVYLEIRGLPQGIQWPQNGDDSWQVDAFKYKLIAPVEHTSFDETYTQLNEWLDKVSDVISNVEKNP